ncbi:MAG: hypothetical protein ACHREM_11210 [Polyangiales bacterium]
MRRALITAASVITFAGCSSGGVAPGGDDLLVGDRAANSVNGIPQHAHKHVCSGGSFSCFAHVRVDAASGDVSPFATPSGFGASDLQAAYNLDVSVDPGATIAIVDAFGYPNAESDLAAYRSQMGLPACTIASGCLTIVNQTGATSPLPKAPAANDDWTVETALDLDMASSACPKCKLLLVQANDDTSNGLYVAQGAAVSLGATVISNSWGGPEQTSDPATNYESYFNHPGVGIFVASGDSGYDDGGQGPNYPGTSAYVVAVGGTSLVKSASTPRGWVESAWGTSGGNGAGGSGCSLSVPKPSWQGSTSCSFRASADVSAVGDPNTGLSVYNKANGGWIVVGGTSAATPFVAGVYALTGHGGAAPSFAYQNIADFNDITSGSNGSCGNVLCDSGAGWDGPTGIGSPIGSALKGSTSCTPSCSGKSCGGDGCGGSCGSCASGSACTSAGQCSTSCTPSCSGLSCGNDGCGGSCGTCASGTACSATGQCVAACTPSCSGKTCGSDGCGGTCGSCSGGTSCSAAGQCVGGSCSHSICKKGKKLTGSCDPCATEVCAKDSYCCSTSWDSICVGEVASICGEGC